ncbi:HNH endonuclease [Rhizobium sp. IMFF44]|uniref:HNH endonuclease signature motif containing protein n=1 Tax=Rhizobium sp. IMFF44 TaxID=3342350 RepID=UPI0035B8FA2D
MASKPKSFRLRGTPTSQQREREYDRERDQRPGRQWYKTYRWQCERAEFLALPENQFCRRCEQAGLLNAGHLTMHGDMQSNPRRMHLVVDHIKRHHGNERLFWDWSNWQPLCPDHHDIVKQAEERAASPHR